VQLASTSVASKTVLIADDTAFVRDRFRAAVEQSGHRAILASTASELLAHLRSGAQAIDLIVLDLRLPQSPGVDLVRTVRKLDAGRAPVLVFSGTIASAEEVRELAALGAAGVDLIRSIRKLADGRLPILIFSGTITSADEVRALATLGVAGYLNEYSATQHILPSLAPHLFPDSFNRRSSPRVVIGAGVQYRVGNAIAAALLLNISRGGIAIRTTSPLDAGSRIKVRFRLPASTRDIDAEGRVAWQDSRVGMGVQFDAVDAAHQAVIDDFVDAHFFTNRKA